MAKRAKPRHEPEVLAAQSVQVDLLDALSEEMRGEAIQFQYLDDVLPFLRALAEGQTVPDAAKTAGFSNPAVLRGWERKHPWFAELWIICEEGGADFLEAEATRRAMTGVDEPVFFQGRECGTITKYSDALLSKLLDGRKPERYKVRHELGGKAGAPIVVRIEGPDAKLG
jgi:hypothetical protein